MDGIDLLCISGGVPLELPVIVEARRRGIPLSNDSQIFLESAPCAVLGITGSAGKTTTTTLVGRIASEASSMKTGRKRAPRVWVGGNIGVPLLSALNEMEPDDLAVMELSSFQLEIMTSAPQVAAILNITPNHLDRHGTMDAYTEAKAHILDYQNPDNVAVLGRDDPGSWGLRSRVRGRLVSFGIHEPGMDACGTFVDNNQLYLRGETGLVLPLMSRKDILLRGEHNLLNVLAACAISYAANLPVEAMKSGVAGFKGVAHRLEFVRSWGGADWYNDSIATAPERAIADIRSFDEPLVLLAGGRDKDLPWEDFAHLVMQRVDHLILFGEAAEKIQQTLDLVGANLAKDNIVPYVGSKLTIHRCDRLQQAVQIAAGLVEPGDVVLLSPGGTSFDEFHDFEERGRCFTQWVNELV